MLNYKLISKSNPRDVAAEKKFYAVKQGQGKLTMRDIAKRISRESTVSIIDTTAVLEAFLQVVPDELLNGKIIKMGEFGTFRTTLASEGVVLEEEFTAAKIKKVNVRFRPAAVFNDIISVAKFTKISN